MNLKNVISLGGKQQIPKPSQAGEQPEISAINECYQEDGKVKYRFKGTFDQWKQQYAGHHSK